MREPELLVRTMRPGEIAMAVDWAAAEGWNPGFQDAACFGGVDPAGFLIGEADGAAAAIVSNVNYSSSFAFLGFYIVRPDMRGRGYGRAIWQAGMTHAGERTVGLDGVVAQQENYKKSGFSLAYRNVRYGGTVGAPAQARPAIALSEIPLATLAADDAMVFPAPRPQFLKAWIAAARHHALGLLRNGSLAAWGVIRPCRKGYKIGPLVADGPAEAETLFGALIAAVGGGEVFLDVPQPNSAAVALAQRHGMTPVFETARMYTRPIHGLRLDRLYGVTTFELG